MRLRGLIILSCKSRIVPALTILHEIIDFSIAKEHNMRGYYMRLAGNHSNTAHARFYKMAPFNGSRKDKRASRSETLAYIKSVHYRRSL